MVWRPRAPLNIGEPDFIAFPNQQLKSTSQFLSRQLPICSILSNDCQNIVGGRVRPKNNGEIDDENNN